LVVCHLRALDTRKASVCDNVTERVHHGSLDLLQFVAELAEHPGIDKMYVRFAGMGQPHLFVNRPCEGVGRSIHGRELEPGEVRILMAIQLGVKRPFMFAPQAVHHDGSLA
jgi:hypothetical protein